MGLFGSSDRFVIQITVADGFGNGDGVKTVTRENASRAFRVKAPHRRNELKQRKIKGIRLFRESELFLKNGRKNLLGGGSVGLFPPESAGIA